MRRLISRKQFKGAMLLLAALLLGLLLPRIPLVRNAVSSRQEYQYRRDLAAAPDSVLHPAQDSTAAKSRSHRGKAGKSSKRGGSDKNGKSSKSSDGKRGKSMRESAPMRDITSPAEQLPTP